MPLSAAIRRASGVARPVVSTSPAVAGAGARLGGAVAPSAVAGGRRTRLQPDVIFASASPTLTTSSSALRMLGDRAARGSGHLGVDLVGRDLDDRVALGDRVADGDVVLEHGALGDRLAHLGHLDLDLGALGVAAIPSASPRSAAGASAPPPRSASPSPVSATIVLPPPLALEPPASAVALPDELVGGGAVAVAGLDLGQRLADLDVLVLALEDLGDRAALRRRDLGVDLVGRDLDDRVALPRPCRPRRRATRAPSPRSPIRPSRASRSKHCRCCSSAVCGLLRVTHGVLTDYMQETYPARIYQCGETRFSPAQGAAQPSRCAWKRSIASARDS